MRTAQKKQAEEFVELLGQAHEEIRGVMEKKNIPAAMSLLADCQEGAIALGDLIESAEGESAATIPILERYCELVYEIHQSLAAEREGGSPVRADKAYKTLRQGHIRIANSITHEVKVRREVVFLPYKASMWDSLESVWKAADEDPDCDAYVIPIPYYDKNPDGSFREQHYEVGEYPEYVPVVWYEDYDFEKRRPDMIFIHNPYDDCNIVTSVHPFFYSKNLKKFTEKLVYIPYFILGEIDPENKQELESIEKFCLVPGVAYADEVIVQSEDMRQAYINVLTEFMAGQGRSRAYWEKKILGLGSPKVDKVLNTRKEDLKIPEEWMKVIRKPDGSWKKIIFYNTTVTALLQHNEQYLEKMRDVFRIFYENRDEVALLWRPHPLFGATIESMRPELGEAYREIVRKYREEGWGIYDDTADMDRAVCLSDTYYGDESSVLNLFRLCGKDYLIQNPVVINIMKETGLWEQDFAIIEEKLWFVSRFYNQLICYDLQAANTIQRYCLPVQNKCATSFAIERWKDKLIILPFNENKLLIFDLLTQKIECVPLEIDTRGICFFAREIYEDTLFMLARSNNRVDLNNMIYYQIDLRTYSQKCVLDEGYRNDDAKKEFHIQSVRIGEYAFFVKLNGNKLLKICLKSGKYEWINIEFNKQIVTANLLNSKLYLITYDFDVLIYDIKTSKMDIIESKLKISEKYYEHDICSYNSLVYNSKILLIFGNIPSIYEFDTERRQISLSNLNNDLIERSKDYEPMFRGITDYYSSTKQIGNNIYVWNMHNCTFLSINLLASSVHCQKIHDQKDTCRAEQCFSKRKNWGEVNQIRENAVPFLSLVSFL